MSAVDAAFVYGSHASGQARPESDVDILVLGDALDRRALHRSLAEVAMLTGRQVNPGLYTRMKLAERLGRPDSPGRRFLRDVLAGPKTWVAGDETAILPLAIAAGLPVPTPPKPCRSDKRRRVGPSNAAGTSRGTGGERS